EEEPARALISTLNVVSEVLRAYVSRLSPDSALTLLNGIHGQPLDTLAVFRECRWFDHKTHSLVQESLRHNDRTGDRHRRTQDELLLSVQLRHPIVQPGPEVVCSPHGVPGTQGRLLALELLLLQLFSLS